jgi:hypothetical protein
MDMLAEGRLDSQRSSAASLANSSAVLSGPLLQLILDLRVPPHCLLGVIEDIALN